MHLVEFFWNFEGDFSKAALHDHASVASVNPKLAFQYVPGITVANDGQYRELFASGFQMQTNSFYRLSSCQRVGIFGVYFKPYAISLLFNIPANEITNCNIEISEFLGKEGSVLEERILNCKCIQERVEVITCYLENKMYTLPLNTTITVETIQYLISKKGNIKLPELLDMQSLSQRQFERIFKRLTGFSPKYFSRIVRFESSIANCYSGQLSLTDVALFSGYFDQAHMIRDYKEFTGDPPSLFLSDEQSLFVKD